MPPEARPLRLGLIGAGRWGRILIATVRRLPGFDLCWIASGAPDAAALVRPGAVVTPDWRTFAEAGLDGLVIATPADAHGAPLRAAIEAGLPAFVEKPLVTDAAEGRALAALAHARDAVVLVDHTAIFHPGYARLREEVRRTEVRRVVAVGGQWGRRGGDVGALWDYGPHDVALCLDLLGQDARLEHAERIAEAVIEGERCEVIRLHLRWPGGGTAEATFGNAMPDRRRWFAVDDGQRALLLDAAAGRLTEAVSGVPLDPAAEVAGRSLPVADVLPLDRAFGRFAEAIRGERAGPPDPSIDLGVAVVELLAEAERMLGG